MTVLLSELWDFDNPELSEQRFRLALSTASTDDALILQTQIARSYGLRRDFSQARQILAEIEPQVWTAGAEAQVHYYLELGRSYSSATHPPESQTVAARQTARSAYLQAFDLARAAGLDRLAIDALHMLAFVEPAVEDQIEWNRKALAYLQASTQPDAQKWAASLHNNLGYALHSQGRYEAALQEFELALAARQLAGDPELVRIAWWMIAWTLRSMGRLEAALEIQLRLEQECAAVGQPDPYVLEELETLYRALDNSELAEQYAARRRATL